LATKKAAKKLTVSNRSKTVSKSVPKKQSVFNPAPVKKPLPTQLSAKAKASQQALSDKYGVATFDFKGGISTVPTVRSGGFSDINVGIGAFKDFDTFANEAIKVAINNEKKARQSGGGITVSQDGAFIPSMNEQDPYIIADPQQPTRFVDYEASAKTLNPILTNEQMTTKGADLPSDFGLSGVTSFLQEHGAKLGIGLAAFLILMAVVKKK